MNRTNTQEAAPTCELHNHLSHLEQEACSRLMPRTPQEQMTFLITRYQGNTAALAAILGVSRRTVMRHAKGSLLPPRRALRERLRVMVLDALCPIRVREAAVREARSKARRRRRGGVQEEW
ncbi:hypothetical protein SSP35_34_00050 [Streptomyces sp. NBRC 110611]|nr:hypothetical protein SSP35_34_00050 [Streptomyces sp. NBRC 110611]